MLFVNLWSAPKGDEDENLNLNSRAASYELFGGTSADDLRKTICAGFALQ